MVEVGPVAVAEATADDADLAVFVERLASAGSDPAGASAREQVLAAVGAGAAPPGLRRLAEALAAAVTELPPTQRHPVADTGSVVAAMGGTPLVVLEDFGPDGVAAAVAALVDDGRRVVVTAENVSDLDAVRTGLPLETVERALDRMPGLGPREVRALRALLATSTPARRARRDQQIPPASALPDPAGVAELCRRAARSPVPAGPSLVAGILTGLEQERVEAVTSVARCLDRTVGALRSRDRRDWTWRLLAELVHSRYRSTLDRVLEDTAQATAAMARVQAQEPVSVGGALPASASDLVHRYLTFLRSGGRSRQYFRSAAQREVQPVLALTRVGDRVPETAEEVQVVLEYLELRERLATVAAGCAEMGVPAPRDAVDLEDLLDGLTKVAAAARSVAALRHDILFLHPHSPIAVPDLDAAEQIATAILEYAEWGSAADAAGTLDRIADELAGQAPAGAISPEHQQAVQALRERDAQGYAVAVEALDGARRELADERRTGQLLADLASSAPRLARSWEQAAGPDGPGLVVFVPIGQLLGALPPADSADVVLVVGADRLGVDRLLLAAVAPRLIAVVAPGSRSEASPTMLSVLQRAGATVIRGQVAGAPSGRVLRLAGGGERATVAAGDTGRRAGA